MPDKITLNKGSGIIQIQSYGKVSRDDIAESINKIRYIFSTRGFNKILVDTTQQEKMPNITDIYELFSTFPQDFRLAILMQESQRTAEDISFVETVSLNRGVDVKVFDTAEQAKCWLEDF